MSDEMLTMEEFEKMLADLYALMRLDMQESGESQTHVIDNVAIKTDTGKITINGIALKISPREEGEAQE